MPIEVREKFVMCLDDNNFLKPLCLTMMFAGLRTGECLGLQRQDIDFENKMINIERGVTIVPKFNSDGKVTKRVTAISETKTACSKRSVPMPDILIDALKEYQLRQAQITDKCDYNLLDKNALVFANNDGSVRTYSGTKKTFQRFLKKHDLKKYNIHFHGLRHTYSNMLFEAEQNPKLIQTLLGHKDVKTTISIYNSIDKTYMDKASKVLNEQFNYNRNENIVNQVDDENIDELIELLMQKKMENQESEVEIKKQKKKDFEM